MKCKVKLRKEIKMRTVKLLLLAAVVGLIGSSIFISGCKKSAPEPKDTAGDQVRKATDSAAADLNKAANTVKKASEAIVQTKCPVMGGDINNDIFVEYKGKKVYFCCPGCVEKFKADPEKYLSKLPQFQEQK